MTTVISFCTPDAEYVARAAELKQDCIRLGLPHRIEELPSTGSYLKNTCMKPEYIRDCLRLAKSPVLWVDCDGSILKHPTFFDNCNGFDFVAKRMSAARDRTWHVGTMWFNYTPAMMAFIDRWCENTQRISDESALERTWQELGDSIKCSDLPITYFEIVRRTRPVSAGAVIIHRISDWDVKRKELPKAIEDAKKGIW